MKRSRIAAVICICPAVALAHTGQPLQPHDLWSAWEFDPGVVIPLAISGVPIRARFTS